MNKQRGIAMLLVVLTGSVIQAQNCPVVDFGDDLCWYGRGMPAYRLGAPGGEVKQEPLGGGNWRIGQPFSLTFPLNPASSEYNHRGNNTIFYGGMMTLVYNSPDPQHHWTEGGVNIDHDGFDDFNYMGFGLKSTNNFMRAFGVWLWKKENFLNGGDQYPVTFDEKSRVAVFLSRTYAVDQFKDTYALTRTNEVPRELWRGWEDVELVVQDGDQFYIAQTDFRPKAWTVFQVSPTQVKWAKWNPQGPWDFEWDRKTAVFEEHTFKDVRAAGWMIAKPTAEIATFWLKWYAFGMDAVVNRSASPGWTVPLVPADRNGLYIAQDEVTYEQWIKVYKWASRNQYCMHPGYSFNRDGNPGFALTADSPVSTDAPVTGITWQDAALWCNALSEYEGRTPAYYSDAAMTNVLRRVKNRTGPETVGKLPSIRLKEDADGYRLPLPSELSACKLWNFIWDADRAVFDPAILNVRTVLGGSGDPTVAKLPAGEIPSRGHYAISFRPVRREGAPVSLQFHPLASAPGLSSLKGMSAWSFGEEEVIKPAAAVKPGQLAPQIPLVELEGLLAGKTEITYAQWRAVFNWAEINGYGFDHDGDIGSLKWDDQTTTHSPDEPVTSVSVLDAMVWCNALSEMNGLKPCYYDDPGFTRPMRTVHPARALALPDRVTVYHSKPVLAGIFPKLFFTDEKAGGFRLPMNDEWNRLAGGETYPAGRTLDPDTAWFEENSGYRTRPAGSAQTTGAGFHDLAGNVFEWTIGVRKDTNLFQSARGGSFRSENRTGGSPLRNGTIAANWSFGGSMNIGVANAEIGFRVVRASAQ